MKIPIDGKNNLYEREPIEQYLRIFLALVVHFQFS
jgi:hypothetical protein